MSWKTVHLKDVAIVSAGNSAPQDESLFEGGVYNFYRTSDVGRIRKGVISNSLDKLNLTGIKGLKLFAVGTILFPKSGASTFLNHRVILGNEGYVSSHLATIKAKNEFLDDKYLFYFLTTIDARDLIQDSSYPSLRTSVIETVELQLPPLPTQQKIVAKLDAIFAEIDKAQAAAEANAKNADALFQSYLAEVFESGGKGWIEKKLKEITTKIGSGATPRGGNDSYKETGISLIRSMNVYDEGFYYPKLAFIDETQAKELANVTIEKDDILLNITGGSVARCCVVPSDVLPARVNQHVSIIRVDKNLIYPKLVNFLLISPLHKKRLLNVGEGGGSTRQAITKAQLQDYSICFPASLGLQKELIQKIEEFYSTTFNMEKSYKEKFHNLPLLKQSILQQAFSGELVKD